MAGRGKLTRSGTILIAVLVAAACGRSSRADAIVGDETLFNEQFPEALKYMREECPGFAESAGAQVEGMPAIANAALTAAVPEGYRPELARVKERHGEPDSVANGVHYYDDIGLRVDDSGVVTDVDVPCVRP